MLASKSALTLSRSLYLATSVLSAAPLVTPGGGVAGGGLGGGGLGGSGVAGGGVAGRGDGEVFGGLGGLGLGWEGAGLWWRCWAEGEERGARAPGESGRPRVMTPLPAATRKESAWPW